MAVSENNVKVLKDRKCRCCKNGKCVLGMVLCRLVGRMVPSSFHCASFRR